MADQSVYFIPAGPKNLDPIFPGLNWANVKDYYIQVLDVDGNVVSTSPIIIPCNCANDESVVISFLNYLGAFDTVIFQKPRIIHEPVSGEYKKGLTHPLSKTDTGIERFNVTANDNYEAKRKCKEAEMIWLQESAGSPKAFMAWAGTEGQADNYLPIRILDFKFDKLKNDREFEYDFVIQFKLANEFFSIRN